MELAAITSAVILTYIQSATAIHVNFTYTNSTVLGHAVKVPKCCKEGSIMTDRGCIEDNMHLFSPTVNVLMHNSTHVNDEPVTAVDFETFVHNIDCAMGSYPLLPEDNFCLLENGSLVVTDQHRLLLPSQFCFETVDIGDVHEKWITTAFVCVPLPPTNKNMIFLIIYSTGLGISCALLALICLIYGCLLKRSPPQSTWIISYSLSLLGCFAVVGLAQIIQPTATMCDILGTLFHVMLISAVGSLTLITSETYCRIRVYEICRESYRSDLQLLIIILSSLLILITLFLAFFDVVSIPRIFLKPELGQNSCWITGEKTGALYFTIPVIAAIVLNITMLVFSQMSIRRSNRRNSGNDEWEMLKDTHFACFGVLIVMVLCWGVETASLVLNTATRISVALDVLESLQGLVAFLVFTKLVKNDILTILRSSFCGRMSSSDHSRNTSDTSVELLA